MKHIQVYEFYSAKNLDTLPMLTTVPNFETDCISLAKSFLIDLGKNYILRTGKPFDKKEGNCAWFSKEFYRWCELYRIPVHLVYFEHPDREKGEDHIAPVCGGWVIDFAIKQFTKNPKEEFKVSKVDDYKKYGYDPNKAEVLEVFPDWIQTIHPLKERKWPKNKD